ncbi:MAG TPA: DUF1573 domain-containing protein [Cyclobacteriaceae bacterium]|nr:DUF1573 domain-containing protein [Cyclobacteriaceae bacterium]
MKKLLFLAALALATAGYSQTTPGSTTTGVQVSANADLAEPLFETQNFDFGKIKGGIPATHEFRFTNKGKVTMIITDVRASCGCTTPSWTKDPIPPGGQGFVTATYNAATIGVFNKSITVTANVPNNIVVLSIKGEVIQEIQ